ncbi:hypothetical protein A8709_15715 [Paenibacillus pectinilyticus]|uniref:Fibronectin type-III domain-containing protein n=1 Tax=Paenibacillus pectinilyticus TaxID=512399 RepID=A0A1C1A4N0_9BACL|nr:fibronectin type III domain-containing protein [Paenibacillus pectinilyticus]OCT15521.1 hypothetical protein A8709_15715 [Paenibacillus pectinilyticus]
MSKHGYFKYMTLTLVAALLFSIAAPIRLLPAYAASPNDNLLANPGFENGTWNGWGFFNASQATVSVQNTVKRSGNYAFKAAFTGNSELQFFNDVKPVTTGANYYYEVWVKSENMIPSVVDATYGANYFPAMKISSYNGSTWTGHPAGLPNTPPNQDWTKVSGTFVMPAGADSLKFLIGRFNPIGALSGSVYYDDAFLALAPTSLGLTRTGSGTLTGTASLTNLTITANYGATPVTIAPSDSHLSWAVTSGNATISGGNVVYTGTSYGATVTLQASYLGATQTINLTMNPNDASLPTWTNPTLIITYPDASTARLTWTGATDNIGVTQYMVYADNYAEATTAGTTYDLTVTPGANYTFRIEAGDQGGNWSTTGPLQTLTVPDITHNWSISDRSLKASSKTDSALSLAWSGAANPSTITQYIIYQEGVEIGRTTASKPYFSVTGLTGNTLYHFKVEAVTAAGISNDGPTIMSRTLGSTDNFVQNGGFESALNGWYNGGGGYFIGEVQTAVKQSGNSALHFLFPGSNVKMTYDQYFTVTGGKQYYYSFGLKTSQLADQNTVSQGPSVIFHTFQSTTFKGKIDLATNLPSNQDWQTYQNIVTMPTDINTLRFLIQRPQSSITTQTVSGDLYMDNVFLTRVPDSLQMSTSNTNYLVGRSVDLSKDLTLNGSFDSQLTAIDATSSLVNWEITSGSASLNNGLLSFTGGNTGGNVSLKATYLGKTTTLVIPFVSDNVLPTWPAGSSLQATAKGKDFLALNWNTATDNTTNLTYQVSVNGTAQPEQSTTSVTLSSLATGTSYHVEVRAKDVGGNWTASPLSLNITTSSLTDPIWTAPALMSSALTSSSVTLSWSGATDSTGITQYKLYKSYLNGSQIVQTNVALSNVTSYTVTGLDPITSYTFRIEAGDGNGNWTIGGPSVVVTTSLSPVQVTVHESQIVKPASKDLLGENFDLLSSESVFLTDTVTDNTIRSEFYTQMQGIPLGLARFGGSDSQTFHWKLSLDAVVANRPKYPNVWGNPQINRYGLMEWLNSTKAVDANRKITWTFNMMKETAMDAADLAEFFTGDGVHDPNGGTNWAQQRITLGHPDVVPVATYELGNELDIGLDVDTYIARSKAIIREVRRVDPNAKFAALATTAAWDPKYSNGKWRDWHKKVLQELGNDIDYITFHPYYLGLPLSEIDNYLNDIHTDITTWENSPARLNSSHHILTYISEHGVWPVRDNAISLADSATNSHNLEGTLGVAEFINRMYNRQDVALTTLHVMGGEPWGVLYRKASSTTNPNIYTTGLGDMLKLMNQALGTNVVKTETSGSRTALTDANTTLTVNAITTATGGLNLILINRDASSSRDLTFQFENSYKLKKKTVLTAPNLTDDDTEVSRPITVTDTTVNGTQALTQFTVPSKSMVVLYLAP